MRHLSDRAAVEHRRGVVVYAPKQGQAASVQATPFNRVAASLTSLLVSAQYNIDGDTANETVRGVTSWYLIDTLNSTGLPQAMDELQNGAGVERISGNQLIGGR